MSYHLIAFELINQLLCIDFPSPERKIFLADLKSTLPSSAASSFHNLGNVDNPTDTFIFGRRFSHQK